MDMIYFWIFFHEYSSSFRARTLETWLGLLLCVMVGPVGYQA